MPTGDKKKKTRSANVRTLSKHTYSSSDVKNKNSANKKNKRVRASASKPMTASAARKLSRTASKQMGKIAKSVGSRHRENPASVMAAERAKYAQKGKALSGKKAAKLGLATKKGGTGMDIKTAKKAGLSTGRTKSGKMKSTKK